jgi:hypothetical protein
MPFDAAGFTVETTLDDFLKRLGITPVPMAQLLAHKKQQLRRNPPSLFATPKPFLFCGMLGCFTGLVLHWLTGNPMGAGVVVVATLLGMCTLAASFFVASAIVGITGMRLRGRAYWKEAYSAMCFDRAIPEPIREVVQRVRRSLPENGLIVTGELIQNEAVIDPYVVVHLNGQRACLGIWLDDKVIACATM